MEAELAKLAQEAQLEKSQSLVTQGREAVRQRRGGAAGGGALSHEDDDEEDDEEVEAEAEAGGADEEVQRGGAARRRKHRSVFARGRAPEEVRQGVQRHRLSSVACGVSSRDSVFRSKYPLPALPMRVRGEVVHGGADEASAEEMQLQPGVRSGVPGAAARKRPVVNPGVQEVARRQRRLRTQVQLCFARDEGVGGTSETRTPFHTGVRRGGAARDEDEDEDEEGEGISERDTGAQLLSLAQRLWLQTRDQLSHTEEDLAQAAARDTAEQEAVRRAAPRSRDEQDDRPPPAAKMPYVHGLAHYLQRSRRAARSSS